MLGLLLFLCHGECWIFPSRKSRGVPLIRDLAFTNVAVLRVTVADATVFTACIGQGGNSWKNISEKNHWGCKVPI